MLTLTLLLIIWIETFYVLSLRIPDWTEEEVPYQGWLAAQMCKELSVAGVVLLWLFWCLALFGLLVG